MSAVRSFFALMAVLNTVQSQTSQSIIIIHQFGTDFIPAYPVELIATYTDISTVMSCYHRCHLNSKCRTMVTDTTWLFLCRLYEDFIDTDTIIFSSSSASHVGSFHHDTSLYTDYNHTCNPNSYVSNRFLICNNK